MIAASIATVLAVVVVIGITVIDVDPSVALPQAAEAINGFLRVNGGQIAAVTLLYLEESGVPLPVPGDVYVMYLGAKTANSVFFAGVAWVVLTAAVVLGSTNLYLISLAAGAPASRAAGSGRVVHLTPQRGQGRALVPALGSLGADRGPPHPGLPGADNGRGRDLQGQLPDVRGVCRDLHLDLVTVLPHPGPDARGPGGGGSSGVHRTASPVILGTVVLLALIYVGIRIVRTRNESSA